MGHLLSLFYVISWSVKTEISYSFSCKYPFKRDCLISNQCCLIFPALGSQSQKPLTWGSVWAQQKNHAPVKMGCCWQNAEQWQKAVCALPMVINIPFFLFISVLQSSHSYSLHYNFLSWGRTTNQNGRVTASVGCAGCSALLVSSQLQVCEDAQYCNH